MVDKYVENEKKQKDYTYVQREEERKLDAKGKVKSVESRTSEVMILYGQKVERLIAKNDKPLSEKESTKQEEKIQKAMEQGNALLPGFVLRKRLEQQEVDRAQNRGYVREVSEAYNFRLTGVENLAGRDTYVIDADPSPGFRPNHKEAKILPKFRFRIWIDKAESQWVKLDAQCIDTVSFGLFLVRLHKGSRVFIETMRINEQIWLPKHVDVKVDARLGLLKGLNEEIEITYHDYKKFRTDTKIVGVGEAHVLFRERGADTAFPGWDKDARDRGDE